MIKFLGLRRKKKIKAKLAAAIYVEQLNRVINGGFTEIKDFINHNNNLEGNPNLADNDVDWFSNIVFLGNIQNLKNYFEEIEVVKIRAFILDEMYKKLDDSNRNLAIERFLDYEDYFAELMIKNDSDINAMAYGIFEKYNINNFQGDLFKRKNKPNPIFYNELKNLLKHFIWNWEEYLEKNRLTF